MQTQIIGRKKTGTGVANKYFSLINIFLNLSDQAWNNMGDRRRGELSFKTDDDDQVNGGVMRIMMMMMLMLTTKLVYTCLAVV